MRGVADNLYPLPPPLGEKFDEATTTDGRRTATMDGKDDRGKPGDVRLLVISRYGKGVEQRVEFDAVQLEDMNVIHRSGKRIESDYDKKVY